MPGARAAYNGKVRERACGRGKEKGGSSGRARVGECRQGQRKSRSGNVKLIDRGLGNGCTYLHMACKNKKPAEKGLFPPDDGFIPLQFMASVLSFKFSYDIVLL